MTDIVQEAVAVEPLPEHRLRVSFDDGSEGVVDVAQMVDFTGVFEPLRDPAFFAQAQVNTELGTVSWPNGADLDSDVLYARVTGVAVPEYVPAKK